MAIDRQALEELLQRKFGGSYNLMAKETGVDASVLYGFLRGKVTVGLKNDNRLRDYLAANAE